MSMSPGWRRRTSRSCIVRALDGLGVAFTPEYCKSRLSVAEGRLVLLLPEWHSREATVHLVYTSRRGMLPGVRAVIDFAASALDLSVSRLAAILLKA